MRPSFNRTRSQRKYSVLLAIVGVLLVSAATYLFTRQAIRDDRNRIIHAATAEVTQHLKQELDDVANDLNSVVAIAGSGDREYERTLGVFVSVYLDTATRYPFILVIDPKSRRIVTSNDYALLRDEGINSADALFEGAPGDWVDKLNRGDPFIMERTRLTRVAFLWPQTSRRRLRTVTAQSQSDSGFYMVIARPVMKGHSSLVDKVVLGIISWDIIQTTLDDSERLLSASGFKSGYASLYAKDGNTILGNRNPQFLGKKIVDDFNLPLLSRAVLQSTPTQQQAVRYMLSDKPKSASIQQLAVPSLGPSFIWYVAAGLNDDDAFQMMDQLLPWFLLTPIMVVTIIVIVHFLMVRKMKTSILRFAEIAKEVAEGKESLVAEPDEVDEISDALHQVLLLLKAKSNFKPVENPYIAGNPIRTPEMFFGRGEDLRWIGRQLTASTNTMIGLFGQRRIGKTSLLQHLNRRDYSSNLYPIFIDTQEMLPEISGDASFYRFVSRKLLEQGKCQAPDIMPDSPHEVAALCQRVRKAVAPQKLVVLIDELENLNYKFANGVLSGDIPLFLASLLEGPDSIAFVVTGSDQLELKSDNWKVLAPKLLAMRLGMLNPKDAKLLVTRPLRDINVAIDESIRQRLLRLSGCHPYYTQLLCRIIVDELNKHQQYVVAPKYLEEAVRAILDSPPSALTYVWTSFANNMRIVSSAYALSLADDEQFVEPREVIQKLPRELLDAIPAEVAFRTALEKLCEEDWLQADNRGAYRYKVDLFRHWVRRYHSIWQVVGALQKQASA